MKHKRVVLILWLVAALLIWTGVAVQAGKDTPPQADTGELARTAFDRLLTLEGVWQGNSASTTEAAGDPVVHHFRVSANGTVLMETMNPGTDHEMINMYHLDGDDLVLTHYCAGGNQPQMRLDPGQSTGGTLVFAFAGGTNLDPTVDGHIHSARLVIGEQALESHWTSWSGGEPAGEMLFSLGPSAAPQVSP